MNFKLYNNSGRKMFRVKCSVFRIQRSVFRVPRSVFCVPRYRLQVFIDNSESLYLVKPENQMSLRFVS